MNINLAMAWDYDVMVIGAGPAGAVAAARAAREGARVLLVERKAVPGIPVRCAEYIPAMLLREVELPRQVIVQRVKGMRIWLPDGTEHTMAAPGAMIDRGLFDQALVAKAQQAGVQVKLGCRAIRRNSQYWVTLQEDGKHPQEISTGVIIGADGPHSTAGRWIDAPNTDLLAAVQVSVPLTAPLEMTEVYFDADFFGGYGWLFPKNRLANVGLGLKKQAIAPVNLRQLLTAFIDRLVAANKITSVYHSHTAGWIPAAPMRTTVHENVLLAGDAAGQTHPITGAGVLSAVVCGNMAGKWAARAALARNPGLLQNYATEWQELLGDTLQRAVIRRQTLETNWNDLNNIIRSCWVAFGNYYRDPV